MEGWTVFCFGLDLFYDMKKKIYHPTEQEKRDLYFEREQAAVESANQWLMIPLTRAINHLVIHFDQKDHELTKAFMQVADSFKDTVIVEQL